MVLCRWPWLLERLASAAFLGFREFGRVWVVSGTILWRGALVGGWAVVVR